MLDHVLSQALAIGHFIAVLLASIGCAATVIMALHAVPAEGQSRAPHQGGRASSASASACASASGCCAQQNANKAQLALTAGGMTKQIVDTFNLTNWLSTETAKQQLAMAGFRGARRKTRS